MRKLNIILLILNYNKLYKFKKKNLFIFITIYFILSYYLILYFFVTNI